MLEEHGEGNYDNKAEPRTQGATEKDLLWLCKNQSRWLSFWMFEGHKMDGIQSNVIYHQYFFLALFHASVFKQA